jgi:hypothetical protein
MFDGQLLKPSQPQTPSKFSYLICRYAAFVKHKIVPGRTLSNDCPEHNEEYLSFGRIEQPMADLFRQDMEIMLEILGACSNLRIWLYGVAAFRLHEPHAAGREGVSLAAHRCR